MLSDAGRVIITFGVILIVIGAILWISGKLPFLGKLLGDILIKKENFTFYALIATTIAISLILSIVLTIISNIRR